MHALGGHCQTLLQVVGYLGRQSYATEDLFEALRLGELCERTLEESMKLAERWCDLDLPSFLENCALSQIT